MPASRELDADDKRYHKLLETLPLMVYSAEPTPPYAPIYVSRGLDTLGYSRAEWLAIPDRWVRSIHPDDRERVLSASQKAFERSEPLDDEYRMIARDGSVRWIHDRGSFVLNEEGDAVEWRGVLVDVTERKEAELALIESEREHRRVHDELKRALALLEATIESTTDGLLVVDLDGRMVRMNRKFMELWRIPESIVATRDDDQALAFVLDQLESPEEFLRKVRELYANLEAESFDTLRFKDGRVYERASKPQRVEGRVVGRVWSFRDVTARLELEAQVRQSHKMEAIGSLAGGIAHDFNNILTVIRGHVEMLLGDNALPPDHRADLSQVYSAAERAMTLTRQLLAFSRKQVIRPVVLDISDVVRNLEPMLRRLIGEDIAIDVSLHPRATVTADLAQIEQILLNLVVNARDAMPGGGRIFIATQCVRLAAPERMRTGATISPGNYVRLVVRDTGHGIEPEWIDRIFEPFFTTKDARHGTGLGLAMVYGIVKQAEGFVDVESEVDVGTTFSVMLPLTSDRPITQTTGELPAFECGCETILLVEDEDAVRLFVHRALAKRGYTLLTAASAAEALEVARRHDSVIHLILSDVVMPGMGGTQLVEELRRMGIEAPVVYMTGYTDDEIIRRGVTQSKMLLLQKPFTTADLTGAVQKALRHSSPPPGGLDQGENSR